MARRITLGELPPSFRIKTIKLDKITQYGDDNNYPTRMERIISASVTAKSSSNMLTRFLVGKGFKDPALNDIIVGKDEYQRPVTAYKLLTKNARSIAKFNGFYNRVQYDANFKKVGLRFESFKYCRLGIVDDNDYSGKVIVYNNWDKYRNGNKTERSKFKVVDVYNPNVEVLEEQIKKGSKKDANPVEAQKSFKGQMYFNFIDDEYIYPVSPIDPVLWDADTESQIGKFKNGELRRGFFLKYIIHHTQFENQSDADDFVAHVNKMIGGDHEVSTMILEGTFDKTTGKLVEDENIKIEKIEQNINSDIFEAYEKSTQNNIRKAFDAIPQVLIDYETSALGTTSGEAIMAAAKFYNSQTVQKRAMITESFEELFKNWGGEGIPEGAKWDIEPLTFES